MMNTNTNPRIWLKLTITLVILTFIGVGTWALVDKIDSGTVKILIGVVLCLAIVVVVGGLFLLNNVAQAYVLERRRRADQQDEAQQLAMARLLVGRGSGPSLNVSMPEQMGHLLPGGTNSMGVYDGRYVDTTAEPVELE